LTIISTTLRSGPPRLAGTVPAVHLLGNGRYSVWLSEAGMGRSSWLGSALSRWSGERIEDADGWRFWLRDLDLGRLWPLLQPASSRPAGNGTVLSGPGLFGWQQRDHGIEARVEVCVAPGDDAELRCITLTNRTDRSRRIDLTGCLELVLNDADADAAHPAFSKLFVQTAREPGREVVVATRRPRGPDERHPAVAHAVVGEGAWECETDRDRFLGRGRAWSRPAALATTRPLAGTVGSVLDPVFATRRGAVLAPGEQRRWTFLLAAGASRDEALATLSRLERDADIDAALSEAPVRARGELERLGIGPDDADAFSALAGVLLYGDPRLRAAEDTLRHAGDDAPVRAALGIPARSPLVVVRGEEPGAEVEWDRMRRAIGFWRAHGIAAELAGVGGRLGARDDEPGVRVAGALDEPDRHALEAGAHIVVRAATRPLLRSLFPDEPARAGDRVVAPLPGVPRRRGRRREREALLEENGYGGFSTDGREYVIHVDALHNGAHRCPPLPWVNVIANERFGTLVSESGAGFTWSGNSREHRLTPWFNDPVLDPHGELLYVVDDASGAAWSPLPGPLPHPAAYETRHGLGYSRFLLDAEDLAHDTRVSVHRDAPVKFVRVRLTNRGRELRRVSLVSCARLVLGSDNRAARRTVTERDAHTGALLAVNAAAGPWSGAIAFSQVLAPDGAAIAVTTDRAAFMGRHGPASRPAALRGAAAFDGVTGPMHDPCFAWHVTFELPPGESADTVFLLGEAQDVLELRSLLARFPDPAAVALAESEASTAWDALVSRVRIETPAPELDLMVNAWLPYQTLSCRIWGRSAFYQSGGAFGFRDQLQDALSLLPLAPARAREQIVLNAGHQFPEGDVLHWWHPPRSQGMRTRFADDLLWLPYLTATYVRATGDLGVLDAQAAFVSARPLAPGEDEAYLAPTPTAETASVYEHAARAIDRSLAVGEHGLPLFGCGDWNDGMNRVGRQGRGESVWMGWFLFAVLDAWADIAEGRDEAGRATRWRAHRDQLRRALESQAWDGDWYRRGWYDNGEPLGSKDSDECRIDALAQAWSVISGAAPRARALRAMAAVESRLVSEPEELIRLLTPPFADTPQDPGYIKGYVAGVRENGGQYTHAALWVVRAFAELGRRDLAARLLGMLSPVSHARDLAAARRYRVEPYVIAADVYGVAPHVGRGGWTWYTGSSGWMYRVTLESVLGVRLENGNKLAVKPCIPDEWPGFRMCWQLPDSSGTSVEIVVNNPESCAATVVEASYDGRPVRITRGEARVPLLHDGAAHRLVIRLGAPARAATGGRPVPPRPGAQ
jgi:cyclic beta-1,2-glucan synthetase